MTNVLKLNWPSFTDKEHNSIIQCYYDNLDYVEYLNVIPNTDGALTHEKKNISDRMNGFHHLINWPDQEKFWINLLQDYHINEQNSILFTIQKMVHIIPPHSDIGRLWSAYYLLQGQAQTIFYTIDPSLFVREKSYHNDWDKLVITEKVVLELHTWYLFNNRNIHAVINPHADRMSISCNLSNFFTSFDEAIEKINNSGLVFKDY